MKKSPSPSSIVILRNFYYKFLIFFVLLVFSKFWHIKPKSIQTFNLNFNCIFVQYRRRKVKEEEEENVLI